MRIEILGTESLGVRGLCCLVHTRNRHIVIDPGVALGYRRAGLLPHPVQIAAGEDVRNSIVRSLKSATDVVISHFHGDHMPLADANPYQLPLQSVSGFVRGSRLWMKGPNGEKPRILERRNSLIDAVGKPVHSCDGKTHGSLKFSKAMPHGSRDSPMGSVIMTRVEDGKDVFIHASDIQLLTDEPVRQILEWRPTILLVSGPPLYLGLRQDELARARKRIKALADETDRCIIDHHLLRCRAGIHWLDELKAETEGKVVCAADFMGRERRFLEAERAGLYNRFPVRSGWHEAYGRGSETTWEFRNEDLFSTDSNV
jgi:predicted metallo-beta-lactamase superfamily hydrolase